MYLTLIFIFTLIMPFIVMPKYIRAGIISPYKSVVMSMLGTTTLAVVIFIVAEISGVGVYEQLYEVTELVVDQAIKNPMMIEMFDTAGISEADRATALMNAYDFGLMRLPSSIMFMAAIVSYSAYIITSNLIGRKHEVKKMPKFREFSFPHGAGMAIMLMYLISWAIMGAGKEVGQPLYVNINMLFDIVFSIQGIAVVFMFFHFKKAPQVVSVIVSGIMWFTSFGRMFLVLLGLGDLFLGIRGWMAAKRKY